MIPIKKFFKYLFAFSYSQNNSYLFYKTWQQKMLWFIHWTIVREYSEKFFNEDFVAYTFGPMNWEIFEEQEDFYSKWFENSNFSINQSKEISDFDEISKFLFNHFEDEFENENTKQMWNTFIEVYKKFSDLNPKELIDLSHNQKSWIKNRETKSIITLEDIKEDEEIDLKTLL